MSADLPAQPTSDGLKSARKLWQDAYDQLKLGKPVLQPMTLAEATERYLTTHVKPKGLKPRTLRTEAYALSALEARFGADKQLSALTAPPSHG